MEQWNRSNPNSRGGNPPDLRPLHSSPPSSHPDSPLNRPLQPSLSRPPPRLAPRPVLSRPPPSSPPRSSHPFLNRPLPPSIFLRQPPPPPRVAPSPFLSRPLRPSARLDHWRTPAYRHGTQLNSINRYEVLSLLDGDEDIIPASDSSAGHGADNNDGRNSAEDAAVPQHMHGADANDGPNSGEDAAVPQHISNDDSDDDEDPFLTDSYGKLTTWKLSDLEAAFEKHLEDEASKPKVEVKRKSKEERLKLHYDRQKQSMKYALQKYNNEEGLAGEMRFVFHELNGEVHVFEEGQFYEHFNFTAKQAGSMVLFFAEVIPSEDTCNVLCCKPLDGDDNGHCFSCSKSRNEKYRLRHPADESLYVGGHDDCEFPFIVESSSSSEDNSD